MSSSFDSQFESDDAKKAYYRSKTREWNSKPENAAKKKAYMKMWAETHRDDPERRRKAKEANFRFRERNRERLREEERQRRLANPLKKRVARYGISEEAFEAMMVSQCGRCAVCGKDFGERQFSIDHDHGTGRVRGLLCNPCNAFLQHNGRLVFNAVDYLAA